MSDTDLQQNTPFLFNCEYCDFNCNKKSDYNRHILTPKHSKNEIRYNKIQNNTSFKSQHKYICDTCDNSYKYHSGLWRHKKECIINENINNNINNTSHNSNVDNSNVEESKEQNLLELLSIENFMELMKQNNEFKDLILEQNKIIADLAKNANNTINSNNTVNSHNKTFNLNMFLNEKCKDAMNIDEFVDSLKLTFNDLERVGELGFVKGISRIFINGLKELDVYKRPIHCSDLKREVIHLKEDGVWCKDNENKDSMKKLVKMIANKNISKIYEWKAAYPSHRYSDDPKNDIYLKFLCESMGAKTKEEDIIYYEKVIKNVAKEVTIDKNNY
jgi:hypothetical protein